MAVVVVDLLEVIGRSSTAIISVCCPLRLPLEVLAGVRQKNALRRLDAPVRLVRSIARIDYVNRWRWRRLPGMVATLVGKLAHS